jgi:hypothetical protein
MYATLDQDFSMDVDLLQTQSSSENDLRNVLQARWDTATQMCGAARVTIVNDIDDEHIPSSIDPGKFQYCELDYPGCVCDPQPSGLSIDSEPQQRGFTHRSTCRM